MDSPSWIHHKKYNQRFAKNKKIKKIKQQKTKAKYRLKISFAF